MNQQSRDYKNKLEKELKSILKIDVWIECKPEETRFYYRLGSVPFMSVHNSIQQLLQDNVPPANLVVWLLIDIQTQLKKHIIKEDKYELWG